MGCGHQSKNNEPIMRKKESLEKPPCKTEELEKPQSDLKPRNLTIEEMKEKVKEHERKAEILSKAIAGDHEDYFNEYQKLMKTRIEDHTDNVNANKTEKDYDYDYEEESRKDYEYSGSENES